MLEILKFIFSNFWIWLGAYLMLDTIFGGIGKAVGYVLSAFKKKQQK